MIKTKLKTKIKDFGVRTSLIRAADILIIGAACFLFALALTRYFVRDFVLTAIVSIIITLGMLKPIKIKGDKKQRLAFQDALDSACVDYFAFKDCEFILNYFFEALSKRYSVFKGDGFLKINNTFIVPVLNEGLSVKRIIDEGARAKRDGGKTLILLGVIKKSDGEKVTEQIKDLKIEIFLPDRIYKLLKSLVSVPAAPKKIKTKDKIKSFLSVALSPKRTKSYLFVFFSLIIGAFFFTFSVYFIIISGVSLSLAILSRFDLAKRIK